MVAVHNLWNTATDCFTTTVLTSDAIPTLHARGFYSILIILAGAGDNNVDVTCTVGMRESGTFYAPIDANGTDLSPVISALTATKWITFDVGAVAPYIKITVTGTALNGVATTVQGWLMFQEEYET